MHSMITGLFLTAAALGGVSSFHHPALTFQRNSFRAPNTERHAVATEKESKGSTSLLFAGELTLKTDPIPMAPPEQVAEFFRSEENRSYLLSGGSKNPVSVKELTPELLKKWKELAASFGGAEPDQNDLCFSVKTGGVNFPGLKLTSSAIIGSKLLYDSKYPELQFVLIENEDTVQGLPPVVWIYNKLTGKGGEKGEGSESAKSLSRTFVEPSEDGEELVVTMAANLSITVNFPSLLLKILPVSKEKAENQGSSAIMKVLEKDCNASLTEFTDNLVKFIS